MRSQIITALILTIAATGFCGAAETAAADGYSVTVVHSGASGLKVKFQLEDYRLEEFTLGGIRQSRIILAGAGENLQPGSPHLPLVSRMFVLPGDLRAVVRISDKQSRFYSEVDLEVCETPEGFPRADRYIERGGFFPEQTAEVSAPVIARSVRMAALDLAPFRYDRASRTLEVISSLEAEIEFLPDGENPQNSRTLVSQKNMWESISAELLNPGAFPQMDNGSYTPGEYLIIVPDSSILPIIEPLAEWKTRLGFHTTTAVFSQIGVTALDLKNYLQTAYNTWENPPEYVLLTGDMDGDVALPTFYYPSVPGDSAVTDHPYSLLEGTDYFSDIEIGRLSVRSAAELAAVVDKIIQYESEPWLISEYLAEALMIADTSAKNSRSVKQWSRELMLDYGYNQVDTLYYFDTFSIGIVTSLLSQGQGIVNFRGWYNWGGLTAANVRSLNNIRETGVVFGCAGGTNDFAVMEAIGEAFLRAGSVDTARAAAAVIGPSEATTYSKFDGTIDQGMMWGLFQEDLYGISETLNRGKLEAWLCFPWNRGAGTTTNSVECYYHIYNVLGDPALRVWRGQPEEMGIIVPMEPIPFGQGFVDLAVEDLQSQPIERALFVAQHQGNVISTGLSGSEGSVNLPLPANVSGQIAVTVSHPDYAPMTDLTLPIAYQPAFLGCTDYAIDDDNTGASSGNGDTLLNPGETVELYLTLHNFGGQPVNNAAAVIDCGNPQVTVLQAQQLFGNIAPLGSAVNPQPFVLQLGDMEDGEEILIEVTAVGSTGEEYRSQSILPVNASAAEITDISYPSAMADTIIYPGESSEVIIQLQNSGGGGWSGLTCTARSGHPLAVFTDSVTVFPACPAGGTVNNQANPLFLTVDGDLANGYLCEIALFWQYAGGQSDSTSITVPMGIATAFDPVISSDGYGYYCFADNDVIYENSPDFDWVEIDPDFGGAGTEIPLTDGAAFQGDNEVLNLPPGFVFNYYGSAFNQITVCSNGWLAPGITSITDYQNKPIPAAGEPAGMIAPFWDDLMLVDGGEVYYYYQAAENRFIIEWSRVKNPAGLTLETFQVMLYDAAHYVTPTQDSPIAFHYYTVNDVDNVNDYSTVGILNNEMTGGLQYIYSRIFSPGADTLATESALLFTTDAGGRVGPPVLEYSPAQYDFSLQTSQIDSAYLLITNLGEADLEYELSSGLWSQTDGSGGPDAFGYIWVDSDEPGGNPINWIDITGIGTQITFPHNDSTSANLPFGFAMPFYGQNFGTIVLSANGWCSFTSHAPAWNNSTLPNFAAPENLVSAWWDDLNPLEDGRAFIWSNETDSVVVSYLNMEHYGTTAGDYTYQVILEKNGRIAFQYLTMGGQLNSATIGIQNSTKTIGLQMAYNQNYVHNDLRIDIQKPWMSLSQLSGELNENETDSIKVKVSSQSLPPGEYTTEITLLSNDPFQPEPITIPVTLTVTAAENYAAGLRISLSEDAVRLDWEPSGAGIVYQVYRCSTPYFTPGQGELIGETMESYYLDEGALAGKEWFYRVIY